MTRPMPKLPPTPFWVKLLFGLFALVGLALLSVGVWAFIKLVNWVVAQ